MEECDFCPEFGASRKGASLRLLEHDGGVVVFPPLGEIIPGHLLISPDAHFTASIALERPMVDHLYSVVQKWATYSKARFRDAAVIFEHGDPTGEEVSYGQCVSHAHVHLLPRQVDILTTVKSECEHIATVKRENLWSCVDRPYLMVSQDGESFDFFSAADAPRQYLRALYAKSVDVPERKDWFRYASMEITIKEAERWRSYLQENHVG